jgi:hypothetical protein
MVWRAKGRTGYAEGIQGKSGGHRYRCELASVNIRAIWRDTRSDKGFFHARGTSVM